ncbi:MAG TPA: ribosome biogenesis factor YjgA [Gammaproteobacteria bacterium]|nr:ribosome biogenesis factor YjgA [Gammaproteobacteria bacterium]
MAAERAERADWDEAKSKSQRKREHHEVKALGERLLGLAPRLLAELRLDEAVYEAIASARKLQHGALQRQLRHLANLLVEVEDAARIRAELDRLEQPSQAEIRRLHQLERWRDALLAGDAAAVDEIAAALPACDRGLVRQLAQAARQEREAGRPPRAARRLYAYLRDASTAASP